jgi:hypothetical protein
MPFESKIYSKYLKRKVHTGTALIFCSTFYQACTDFTSVKKVENLNLYEVSKGNKS